MGWAVLWIACALVAALVAHAKGRSWGNWLVFGLLCGPLGLAVCFLPSFDRLQRAEAQRHGASRDYRRCPQCAELVRREAVKCLHCAADLAPPVAAAQTGGAYRAGAALARLFRGRT